MKSIFRFSALLVTGLLVVFSGACGRDSGGSSPAPTPTATPPAIFAALASFPAGSIPSGFNSGAAVEIRDAANGAAIVDATVTMNGSSLAYSVSDQMYVGNVVTSEGSPVTVTATVRGNTYTASSNQFASYPAISSPASNSTWSISNPIPVSWSGGTPTQNALGYGIGVLDAGNPNEMLAWPAANELKEESMSTFSDSIPANSLPSGSYLVIACIVGNAVPIPNAAADSFLALAGCNHVPITAAP